MATQLEARLRISADTAQAAAGVRQIKTELASLGQAAGSAGSGPAAMAETLRKKLAEAAANAKKLGDTPVVPKALPKLKEDADAAAKALQRTQRQAAQLVPQLNDIFTQLASGQSPLTVLVQQGPQIRDVMGSWSNAGKALLSVFTPLRVAIGGVAAVAGTFVLAAIQGASESRDLARAIAFTGNAAGVTAGQVEGLTGRIAEQTNQTRGDVRATLTELIATGRFTATSLESAGRGVNAFARLTGRTREEAVADYAAMADGVTAWAGKYDRALNFLSAAQLKQIRELESLGRTQEAVRITSDALAEAAKTRHEPALGLLEKAWRAVGLAVSGVWEALKSIGRDNTAEEELARTAQRVKLLREALAETEGGGSNASARRARIQANLDTLLASQNAQFRQLEKRQGNAAAQADALAEERRKKNEQEATFQSALAQLETAQAARSLAQLQANLDRRRDVIERSHAQGLLDEREFNRALAAIEAERLRNQEANVQRQIGIERARAVSSPAEREAQSARVTQLQAQLIDVRSKIAAAAASIETRESAAALADARTKAAEWAAIWQRAADQVRQFAQRNAARAAEGEADPAERARKAAEVAVAEQKRVFEAEKLTLEVQIGKLTGENEQGQRAELQKQLDKLVTEGGLALTEADRNARLQELQRIFDEVDARVVLQEQAIDQRVRAGVITTVDAEREKNAARADSISKLERILELAGGIAQTPAERNVVEQLRQRTQETKQTLDELRDAARGAAVSSLSTALTDIETGAKRGKEALLDMVGSFARAMLDVLNRRLAEALVKQFADAAAAGGFSNLFAKGASFIASFFHAGGTVGAPGGMRRAVPAAAFALAPRFHGGGTVPPLGPGERPIVAKVGETIRTEEQERSLQRSLGGVQITNHMTISGDAARGADDASARAAMDDLARVQEEAFTRWAVKQMRPGGLLATR